MFDPVMLMPAILFGVVAAFILYAISYCAGDKAGFARGRSYERMIGQWEKERWEECDD